MRRGQCPRLFLDPQQPLVGELVFTHESGVHVAALLRDSESYQAIDPALYEAARMDGAGWWAQFRIITIPLLQPSIVVVLVLAVTDAPRPGRRDASPGSRAPRRSAS